MTDLAAFDPNALKKRVTDAIQTNFGMLVPAEKFQEMVDAAVMEFFERDVLWEFGEVSYVINPKEPSYNQRTGTKTMPKTGIPPFKMMVWNEVKKICEAELKRYFENEENLVKQCLAGMFNAGNFAEYAKKGVVQIAQNMASVQEAKMTQTALLTFKAAMMTALYQSNYQDIASHIDRMLVPSVSDLLKMNESNPGN